MERLKESIALPSKSSETAEIHNEMNLIRAVMQEQKQLDAVICSNEHATHYLQSLTDTICVTLRVSLVVLLVLASFEQTLLNGDVHVSQILSRNK